MSLDRIKGQESRTHFQRRQKAMEQEMSLFRGHWMDISDHLLPRRGRFFNNDVKSHGSKKNGKILSGYATYAMRTLASGLMAGVTSPARPWFRLSTQDPELADFGPVKIWLDDVRNRMLEVFARSNFYKVLPLVYRELGGFGTGAMYLSADPKTVIRAYCYTVGSYAIAQSAREEVDTLYRWYMMTIQQAAEMFGEEKLSSGRRDQLIKNPDAYMKVTHAVEPNRKRERGRLDNLNMPWVSAYFEDGGTHLEDQFLRKSGFKEFPMMAPRWMRTNEDIYGYGPGMDALGDIKELQLLRRRKAQNVDKMTNPPMQAPSHMQGSKISQLPGDVTFYDTMQGGTKFEPAVKVEPRAIEVLRGDIAELHQIIDKAFYVDMFLMISQMEGVQPRNDLEMLSRKEEKLIELGPVLENIHDELLDPSIDRTFNIMDERGMIPPPPEELDGQDLKVEYISMLAQAQKAIGIQSMERFGAFAGPLIQLDPAARHKWNITETMDEAAEMLGVPASTIRSNDEAEELAAAEAKQMQQAQQMEQMSQMADMAGKAGSISTEEGSLAGDALNGGLGG